jgi:hypothetical protein
VAERVVDQGAPEHDEEQVGAELHALGDGARDQGGRDDGEHHLEAHEQDVRDGEPAADLVMRHAHEEDVVEAAGEAVADVGREGDGVADDDPLDGHHAERDEAVHEGREHVAAVDHAAVEQREARRHQEHERARNEHPGGIRPVDLSHPNFSCTAHQSGGVGF